MITTVVVGASTVLSWTVMNHDISACTFVDIFANVVTVGRLFVTGITVAIITTVIISASGMIWANTGAVSTFVNIGHEENYILRVERPYTFAKFPS